MIRRRQPLFLPPPAAYAPAAEFEEPGEDDPSWIDDLRFFIACYAAGIVFFLIMLS